MVLRPIALGFFKAISPVGSGDARIVHLSRDNLRRLSVHDEFRAGQIQDTLRRIYGRRLACALLARAGQLQAQNSKKNRIRSLGA